MICLVEAGYIMGEMRSLGNQFEDRLFVHIMDEVSGLEGQKAIECMDIIGHMLK